MRHLSISIIIIVCTLLASCAKDTESSSAPPVLIAHAGGAIDGFVYTNSLEALKNSIEEGYSYIEFDFNFTADSVLVATHDWQEFNASTGHSHKLDTAPSFKDFAERRINGKYTPLSAQKINEIFENNENLFLVTDKVSSPEILTYYFPRLKERMVVEAFSYEEYSALKKHGYHRVLYSCMASDLTAALVKHLLFHNLFTGEKIEWVSLHTSGFDYPSFKLLNAVTRFNIALFTINDTDEIPVKYRKKIGMIYTDSIKPTK